MRMGLFSSASWTGSAHRQALAQSCHLQPHALRRHPRQMRRMHLHACQASTPAQRPLPIHGSEMSSQCLETASSSRQGDAVEEPASPKPTPDAHTSRRQAIRMLAGTLAAATLTGAGEARAKKQLEIDGETVEAWGFDVPLRVVSLLGSVPSQWAEDFKAVGGPHSKLSLQQRGQLADIYSELVSGKGGKKSAAGADLVTVGDTWLAAAIREEAIQPLRNHQDWRWWELMPRRWQQLALRDRAGQLDPEGLVWAVPYRWGCTLVAYNYRKLERLGCKIEDWSDLLNPALKGQIGMGESPREALGVAFKTLGLPLNAESRDLQRAGLSERTVSDRVRQLREQVKVVSDRAAARALVAKDVAAVVGWSQDLAPLTDNDARLRLVAPSSGTILWADMWAVPSAAGINGQEPSPLVPLWLEIALQPARVSELTQLQRGLSPLMLPEAGGEREARSSSSAGTATLGQKMMLGGYMPDDDVLVRSNFLTPLSMETQALYMRLLSGAD